MCAMTSSPIVALADASTSPPVTPPPAMPPATPPPSSPSGGIDPNLLLAAFGITAAMWLASQGIANEQCKEFQGQCKYRTRCSDGQTGIVGKTCVDPRGVSGLCERYGVCKATNISGFGGGGAAGMNPLQTALTLAQLLMLMNSLNSSSGGSSPTGSGTCGTYYQVWAPTSDPCAYYVPGATGQNGISNTIDTSFAMPTQNTSNVSDLFKELYGNTQSELMNLGSSSIKDLGKAIASTTKGTSTNTTTYGDGLSNGLGQGVSGNVEYTDHGATVVVTRQGTTSAVAGFYGSDTTGTFSQQGIVAKWCKERPWATNFLRFIIPPMFFDSLCTLRGYRVGSSAPGTTPGVENTTKSFTSGTTVSGTQTQVSSGPKPQADIWSVPPAVKLGARTTIFWSAKNVISCEESSPDGNFSQKTLSGGAATVALSGPTTFTIVCTAADGSHVSDYVTVNIGN